jgi:hypothetical protein
MRAFFVGGPCDAQDRVFNQARKNIGVPFGNATYDYELVARFNDLLIYAHELSFEQVMELLLNYYCNLGLCDETTNP